MKLKMYEVEPYQVERSVRWKSAVSTIRILRFTKLTLYHDLYDDEEIRWTQEIQTAQQWSMKQWLINLYEV